ncbi:MAG TPA: ATP-dependent helicase HrpB [Geobacterales bacterium]|nr:ATP-dependent helicase HrpB [Geobacterales bacterium]
MGALPVDEIIPQLRSALDQQGMAVLVAPPGAGKTTRVPLALLAEPWLAGRSIVMLEPRRLAAMNAARWMAATLGEEIGQTVGYTIRFDRRVSSRTRLEVVTEGILTRRLQSDPELAGVGLVIFDEFHERNLQADLGLALSLDIRNALRDDLRLLVMSATLDAEPVVQLLKGAPLIVSSGRSFPVACRYLGDDSGEDLPRKTAAGIRRALVEEEGDILAFLPGSAEIRRCQRLLEEGGAPARISPLYGDLPFAEQERALQPGAQRRVVLATNIAETSLTIDGIRLVVDSGFERRSLFDPVAGMNRLVTRRISAASAEQRAGRAGRLAPGVCYRLWSQHCQQGLVPRGQPEIVTSDLSPLVLELERWGVRQPSDLPWLDPPPPSAVADAQRLLQLLGAFDRQGQLAPLGSSMAELPLHPRLARLVRAGEEEGRGGVACDLAAILSERDLQRRRPGTVQRSASDLLDRLEMLNRWRREKQCDEGVDLALLRQVERTAAHLRKLIAPGNDNSVPSSKLVSMLAARAYPDRIGRRRAGEGRRYLLSNGRGVELSPTSALYDEEFLVALAVEGKESGDGTIHLATVYDLESLRRQYGEQIIRQQKIEWLPSERRIVARQETRFGALLLDSQPLQLSADDFGAAVMDLLAGNGPGVSILPWSSEARSLRQRVAFLAQALPGEGWPDLSDAALSEQRQEWLAPWLSGVRSMAELGRLDTQRMLLTLLDRQQRRRLDEEAPQALQVPSGRRVPLSYEDDGRVVLAVKLQEMFGLAETPRLAHGRVPVTLHLLSPAGRPLQITQDLKTFWDQVYPQVKKELKGRYPKHPWPDDPWSAVPTKGTKRRGEQRG